MKRLFLLLFALLMAVSPSEDAKAINASGDVRGVTFFYLDGGQQDFPWVLDHQYDPLVRSRIDKLLEKYREAGVNWIRLLVATDHFPVQSDIHPVPSASVIKKVNDFMAITRAGNNAGRFTVELMLIPQQRNGLFTDVAPYSRDKFWYKTWIDNLNYSNLGLVMLGGDLSPCLLSGCEGERFVEALPKNHGEWIKSMWSWKESNYPALNVSYEVIGVQALSNNDPALIKRLANWINRNTPTNPVIAASLYIELPSGSSWQDYAYATARVLDAYHSTTAKMLWIDEFGKGFGSQWSEQDQRSAYQGFLGASVCWRQNRYPKFAWVAGNDYPYDGKNWYGLVSGFAGSTPIMRDAWSDLSLYYTVQACP
jgi:hypothetical protein